MNITLKVPACAMITPQRVLASPRVLDDLKQGDDLNARGNERCRTQHRQYGSLSTEVETPYDIAHHKVTNSTMITVKKVM